MTLPATPPLPPTKEARFLAELEKAIQFHGLNPNDPHGISNAVICTLVEVRNAFADAYGLPRP